MSEVSKWAWSPIVGEGTSGGGGSSGLLGRGCAEQEGRMGFGRLLLGMAHAFPKFQGVREMGPKVKIV